MKAINISGDEHILRIKSSLMSLQQALVAGDYAHTKIYRQAVARRYTVCYFAYLNYLVARLRVHESPAIDVGMEDIINRCRRANLLSTGDERMMIKMSMLYAALSYFNEGFDAASDELLHDIPEMASFIERFITLHGIVPTRRRVLQATV